MEPVVSLSSFEFTQQIKTLRNALTDALTLVNSAKYSHVHFIGKKSQPVANKLQAIGNGLQDLFTNCALVEDRGCLARSLPKIVQIYVDWHRATRITTLLCSIENESPDDLYATLDRAVNVVVQMANSGITVDKKFEILNDHGIDQSLSLADKSPRRTGKLLLELMRFALSSLKLNNESVNHLQKTIEDRIADRCQYVAETSPRYERSLDLKNRSVVDDDERDEILRKAKRYPMPIAFWSQFPIISRIFRHLRTWSDCERFGNTMQQSVGASIAGLAVRLEKTFQKVIQGKVTPGQEKEFSHKMDIYIVAYKSLKGELKVLRKELFTLAPDDALLPLLRYTSELRFALSEIAVTIDTLQKHSTLSALQIFQAVKHATKQKSRSQVTKLIADALKEGSLAPAMNCIAQLVNRINQDATTKTSL